jgi:flagellum-specific peptidoglycan hydrolase FlgJ
MGRTKLYSDPETTNSAGTKNGAASNATNNNAASVKRGSGNNLPGKFVLSNPESLPVPELFRLMRLRVRRSWVSLRFQFHHQTRGLFERRNALKVTAIAGLGVFVMYGPDNPIRQSIGGDFQGASIVSTSLSFEEKQLPKTGGKTNKWRSKNEAAPVSATELYEEQVADYVNRYSAIARTEMEKYGIPASISLAQGLVESRAGTSKLAVNNNNHFGIKCFSRQCRKGHCSNFTDDTHKDFFKKFPNAWDSWREHSKLLSSGRYKKLQRYGRDYRNWAYGLKSVGYATDRTYAEKLIGIINRYNLDRFDR